MDLEQKETEKRKHTNLRILESIYDLPADEKEGQRKQQVDISAAKYVRKETHCLTGERQTDH